MQPDAPDVPDVPEIANMPDSAELSSYLAGQIGQAMLDRLADTAHPALDQHMAAVTEAVTDVLGPHDANPGHMLSALVRYASGIVDVAAAGGWWPSAAADQPLDWESLRLAAVCQLVSDTGRNTGRPRSDASLRATD